jgi:predicted ATPase/DNA-binding CsgD family transcriptional regulator
MVAPGPGFRLPAELTSFIGREQELTTVGGLLRDARCLTLTGAGGSGKTRLALQIARALGGEFREGAVFVDLAPLTDEKGIPTAVAEAIGHVEGTRRGAEDGLVGALRDAHLLLLLDNCEHVIAACAALVERLLSECPDLRVLATSRQVLDIPGEASVSVPPLSVPDPSTQASVESIERSEAARLFADRARAVRPGFTLDAGNVHSIAAICVGLDGLPLAIELAAARARSLSPAEIQQRLENSLGLLARGPRTVTPRHKTLRATIDWSHELLELPERVLFGRLATFSGGWTLPDAGSVCGISPLPRDILDMHERLLEQSLITADLTGSGSTRYRYLETIRQYAAERLLAAGEVEAMRERHFDCFLQLAERYAAERTSKGSDAELPAVASERDNLRAALSWALEADPERALRLIIALDDFWHMINPAEGWQSLQRAMQRVGDSSPNRAAALVLAGKLAGYVRAYAEGAGLLREAGSIAESSGDQNLAAATELWLGRLAIFAGASEAAATHLARALDGMQALGNPLGEVRALALLGLLQAVILGRREEGEQRLTAATERADAIGDSWGGGYAHMMLSISGADAGDANGVQLHATRALGTSSIAPLHAVALQQLARVVVEKDPGRSLRLLGAAAGMLEREATEEPEFLARRAQAAQKRATTLVGTATAARLFQEGRALDPVELERLVGGQAAFDGPGPPGGLTRRELQVATQVGRLQSNRDIARTLFISIRTAESHVEHILAKLDLANRHELAAWARGNGLVDQEPVNSP